MVKVESPVVIRRTLQAEFGQDTPSKDTIRRTFQHFCETGTVEDRQHSGKSSTVSIRDVCEAEPNSSVRGVATAYSITQTTADRIMTE